MSTPRSKKSARPKSNAQKAAKKRAQQKAQKFCPKEEKRKDDTIIMIIRGLDLLAAKATSLELATIARMLYTAKQDIVYWAANEVPDAHQNSHFIDTHLYSNHMFAAADFLRQFVSLKKNGSKKELLKFLKTANLPFELLKDVV